MQRTYRYRLYPTRRQAGALAAQLRFACELYNAALEQRRWAYRRCGKSVGYHAQSAELTELRRQAPGLCPPEGMNCWSAQEVLRRLDRAFAAFFRRVKRGEKAGYPRFRSARRFDTLAWTMKGHAGGVAVTEEGRLRLQGVGCLKVKWHRSVPTEATLGEVRVTRRGSGPRARFYVSICAELPDPPSRPATGQAVGIDLGVRRLVSLSTGEQLEGPRAEREASSAVRRAARRVARRKRGSQRRRKAAALLARRREREANRRRDSAHKLSRTLVERFDLIAVESLRVANMMRSARGTVAEPATNVAQKRSLNRAIADQSWAQMLSFLAYKAEEAGRRVVKVDPANTSRTCSACGAVDARSRSAKRFRCIACGRADDADVNAANVILARALAQEGIERPGRGRQAQTAALAAVA
ncbi:MAG: IS200/IS605 family element transposase accessory protein TnpB [Solirubrobacterales bacterium]|nr:IS200/IS605 family element transposase accessory protein TnpB [Solirubrobacterales bacterium]